VWGERQGAAQSRAREREAARSREHGWETARGSIAGARERAVRAGRVGLHGTKARTSGTCGACLARSVGWTGESR
jgi:hypothetical protein